jgi:hypothetical protein
MSHALTFREMYPIAQELLGRIFTAVQQEIEDLVAMDRAKMSLVERGRWSAQVLRHLKWLLKEFPEADERTKEGRESINRLRTQEEMDAEQAEIDALFGFADEANGARNESTIQDPLPPSSLDPPQTERQKPPNTATESRASRSSNHDSNGSASPVGPAIDYDAEIAEIMRRIRPGNGPPLQ